MKKTSFLDFLIKNRYSIIGVAVVLVVTYLGWIPKLIEIVVVLGLVWLAIYVGKRIQEDESYISIKIDENLDKYNKENEDKEDE